MKQEIIIGVSVAVAVAIVIVIKVWLYNHLKFKMDESSILNFFEESSDDYKLYSTETISVGTDINMSRVSDVCSKSKVINRIAKEKESWCLK